MEYSYFLTLFLYIIKVSVDENLSKGGIYYGSTCTLD